MPVSELLEVVDLVKHFPARGKAVVQAVDGVSFTVAPGETLGIVGESGSGKSTVARLVLRLLTPTSGAIRFGGDDVADASRRDLRAMRRRMQIVFQDPYSSLDPRMTAKAIVAEPLKIAGRGGEHRRHACPKCSSWSASAPNTWDGSRTSCRVVNVNGWGSPVRSW